MPRSRFTGITLAHNVRERDQVEEVLNLAAAAGGQVVKAAGEAEWGGYAFGAAAEIPFEWTPGLGSPGAAPGGG